MSSKSPVLLTKLTANSVTQTITAAAQSIPVLTKGTAQVVIQITAAASLSGHNISFEASLNSTDGTDGVWFPVLATRTNAATSELVSGALSAIPAYAWRAQVAGYTYFRVRATAHTGGSASYVITRTDFV
jgi:hypothetical protein